MSQQNNKYNPGPPPIGGNVTTADLSDISDEQLEHELQLSYEILHDVHCTYPPYNGGVAIKGMLKELAEDEPISRTDGFKRSLSVWQLRLRRAQEELERRFLLS